MTQTLAREPIVRDVLTQAEAAARAARVSNVRYDIDIDLRAGEETYRGDATIRFDLTGDEPLFLDFRGGAIHELTVGGRPAHVERSTYRLTLPRELLAPEVVVRVRYENRFDTDGDGFHRFVDPEDGEEYVFTDFEPFKSHRLYPNFDQPDIRATYTFAATAPRAWQVISNGREAGVEELPDGRLRHRFETTPAISPYLSALVSGPYHVIRAEHRGIPIALYCRRSMFRHLEPDAGEIVELLGQGLDYFADLFDQPFPFSKWDQVFVPEYNAGAMENVGAVTYNETFLFRDPPTEKQRLDRGEVILHELCHAWFGDLATMRWWNDLWLKESFATYCAYLALTEATRFRQAWKLFHSDIKRWAYRQDQLPTTHPVAGDAPDTEVAFLNFDGITYGKGASVLKQLVATIGMDGFRDGMRRYFRRHAWGNATLDDFLVALEDGSGRSLREWARIWLETASLDTLAAEWRAEDGTIAEFAVRQTAPPEHPVLRPHALTIGLGREGEGGSGNGHLRIDAVPAHIDGPLTPLSDMVGRSTPVLVFPNHEDHAYAKVALDETSLRFIRGSLERVGDPLLRELLWMSLWEMVRDRTLRSTDFLDLVRRKLPLEEDLDLAESVLDRLPTALGWFVPESRIGGVSHAIVTTALETIARAGDRGPSEAAIVWGRTAVSAAATAQDVERLVRIADGAGSVPGLVLDQDMRWSVAVKASAFDLDGAADRVAAELVRDPSDRGRRAATRADVARPDAAGKEAAWDRIHGGGYGSLYLTRAAMDGFFWRHQAPILEPFVPRFFESVEGIFRDRDHSFAKAYMQALFPAYRADPAVLRRARELLAAVDPGATTLVRQLREASDDLARAIAVREFAER